MGEENWAGGERRKAVGTAVEFQVMLNDISRRIKEADNFFAVMPDIQPDMLRLLRAERMTVYQRSRHNQEIVSKFLTGSESREIRVPLTNTSVAGFVALAQKAVRIGDVYDAQALKQIHPNLHFDSSYDKKSGYRTRSMLATPIKHGNVLLGVLQVLNRTDGGAFTDADLQNAVRLANVIAEKFSFELGAVSGPFEFLVKNHKLNEVRYKEMVRRSKAEKIDLADLLMEEEGVSREEIGESLEHYYQVPYMGYDPELEIPRDLIDKVSGNYLVKQLWVPVEGDRNEVTVLIDDPTDTMRIMEIQRVLNARNYVFKVGLARDIRAYLGAQDDGTDAVGLLNELGDEMEGGGLEEDKADTVDDLNEGAAPIIRLVNRVILEGYKSGASDIHIEPGKGRAPTVVRYRIDGVCREVLKIPAEYSAAVGARVKVMSSLDISERRLPQDGKMLVRYQNRPIELRVATVPTVHGEGVVLRILAASEPLPLDKLNLSGRNQEALEECIGHPHGIFLVVGPTGSGKTTTLHSVLGQLNKPDRKIWTAEDPVEITQPGLQQVQVKPKIGFDFASALRAFLRADPDIIMIGEMRDEETASAGVEASLTGHLVLSTLHTNSAPETITRLLDIGLNPINFSEALTGVLAQRLVRTLCPKCKEASPASAEEYDLLMHAYGAELFSELGVQREGLQLHRAKGCSHCGNTGYRGRTGVHELLVATPRIKAMIYKGGTAAELKRAAVEEGMRTLLQDGVWKVIKGDTDMDQLRRVVSD